MNALQVTEPQSAYPQCEAAVIGHAAVGQGRALTTGYQQGPSEVISATRDLLKAHLQAAAYTNVSHYLLCSLLFFLW